MKRHARHGRNRFSALAPGLFAAALVGAVLVYIWSILGAARGPQDWLMILPAGLACIAALLWAAGSDTLRELGGQGDPEAARDPSPLPPALLVLICLYAPATAMIGFDGATPVFIAAALVIQGERRPLPLAIAAFGGTALLLWIFLDLLAVRLPTILV